MNSKELIVEQLMLLADRVQSGEVVGITIVTTNKDGMAQIETVALPSPGDVPEK